MKILVAHCVPRSRTNGMSRMMGFLHDEIAREGHQIDYFCAENAPHVYNTHPGFARFRFPLALLRHALTEARSGSPYDIINVHEPSGAALLLFRHLLPPCKIVATSHGVEQRNWKLRNGPECEPIDRPGPTTRFTYPLTLLWQANFTLRHADHVFCLNEEDRSFIASHYSRSPETMTRIFPAALPIFGHNASYRDYSKKRILLFAGSWLARKGTVDLVRSFTRLVQSGYQVLLTLLNPGVPESKVKAQFPAAVRPRVICRHTESEQATAAVFEECDVFLLPSLFEGTPLTLMEAMWSGLPIVSTATCGMQDVIKHESNGILVPTRNASALYSAIVRLLEDDKLRERVGTLAHFDAAAKFCWPVVAQPVLNSYLRLCRIHHVALSSS